MEELFWQKRGVETWLLQGDANMGNFHGIDWSTLTIELEPQLDGGAVKLLHEVKLFEAMGFTEANEKAAEKDIEDPAIGVDT